MNIAPEIPPELAKAQIAASNPDVSAWVSANAGSGKTYVLAQRVIRLLLDGVAPGKILCLTFTKAAAANMANQVFARLARWTALGDAALDDAIFKVEGRRPDAARRLRARRLFAEALETPGGLKVQTIHAFGTALLHQFPFEADVAARFDVLEERAESELIDRLRLDVLLEAAAAPTTPLGQALATAIVEAADVTFRDVVRDAIGERDAFEAWIARAGSVTAALAQLSRALGIPPEDTMERVEADFFASPHLPVNDWPMVMAALANGSASDQEHITRLRMAQSASGSARVEAYLDVFCTEKREDRKRLLTKPFADSNPALAQRLLAEQTRVCALRDRRKAIRSRDRTGALLTIADAVIARYRAEKERRGLLDYDDLIDKTLALLSGEGSAAWVMYKLDLGIDHVLIDEAQDTSPKQWEVIRRLTAEFTAGAGARGNIRRSIFAVGDEKQSIYSFQGAAPHRFEEMRQHYQHAHDASGLPFEPIPFRHSFRSAPDVLAAIDAVFRRPEAYSGLTADPVPTVHEAVRRTAPGCVEIWPMIEPEPRTEIEAWDAPFDTISEQSPQSRLARRIAATVGHRIAHREPVEGSDGVRAMRPGDVLVLVRQRGGLFEAIIRALKEARVEVAGADRLVLTEHIAVMDLMSLADALLLPEHDLALAEVLKSPLFGLDDAHVFTLAYERRGTLRAALRAKAAEDPRFAAAAAALDQLAVAARQQTPFAFYAGLLGARGGRRKMLARLGFEAADALDEFLALALDYESRHTPSLQGFVAWLRASTSEVKRDMDIVRDEVRVMTVHGAKGLEAPLVILADTTTRPTGPRDPRLLKLAVATSPPDAAPPIVWAAASMTDVPPVAAARAAARIAAEEEHRRLLYVAMTRAADRLIVCGARGIFPAPKGCWYELVSDALKSQAQEVPADVGEGNVWRWQKSPLAAEPAPTAGVPAASAPIETPGWLDRIVPAAASPRRTVTPSSAVENTSSTRVLLAGAQVTREEARLGLRRGRLIHRLLQSLPALAPEHRAAAAGRFLRRAGEPLQEGDITAMIAEVLAVLNDRAFAPLFAPGTRAEVPIVGRIVDADGTPVAVSGQIDRLAVTADAVLIGDFKTERAPPRRLQDVPPGYRRQLALYRAVLMRLYPGRLVRAALIWTQTPELMEIPGPVLDAALASHHGMSAA